MSALINIETTTTTGAATTSVRKRVNICVRALLPLQLQLPQARQTPPARLVFPSCSQPEATGVCTTGTYPTLVGIGGEGLLHGSLIVYLDADNGGYDAVHSDTAKLCKEIKNIRRRHMLVPVGYGVNTSCRYPINTHWLYQSVRLCLLLVS